MQKTGTEAAFRTIKIDIIDTCKGFDKEYNFIIGCLKKHYNVLLSDTPDYLFYSCFGLKHLERAYDKCIKIFFTDENVLPDFNECDYAAGFDYMDFHGRYFRKIYCPADINITDRSQVTVSMADRRFCNFIYSNTRSGEGAVLRKEFCKKLMKYKHVDCPGKVLNNMSDKELLPRYEKNDMESKIDFLKKYKFTIAFENSSSFG